MPRSIRRGPGVGRAIAWLWVAHLADVEHDAIAYEYPRREGWEAELDRLADSSRACIERANAVYGGDAAGDLWRLAMARWDGR